MRDILKQPTPKLKYTISANLLNIKTLINSIFIILTPVHLRVKANATITISFSNLLERPI